MSYKVTFKSFYYIHLEFAYVKVLSRHKSPRPRINPVFFTMDFGESRHADCG